MYIIYLDQSESGSVRFLKAGPLSLFEFVLIVFALYITACLFKSIRLKNSKKKKKPGLYVTILRRRIVEF